MELIWDGEPDSGQRMAALAAELQSGIPPEGVSMSRTHSFVEIPTRSYWAVVTWMVSAIMIGFGLSTVNWMLLILAPFMISGAVMQSLGRVSILIKDGDLSLFEGVGGLGRRFKMPVGAIQRVEYVVKHAMGGSTSWIVVNDAKFGRHLNEEQKQFVIAFLLESLAA